MSAKSTPHAPYDNGAQSREPSHCQRATFPKPARRTLAVLVDYMNGSGSSYQGQLQEAIEVRCRELGYNLLITFGRSLEEPNASSAAHNAIFRLIGPEAVDGILLVSSCLAGFAGSAGIGRLAAHYGSLPICSIGLA
ncbi:hypothetical protein ACFL5O_11680, partial [Myxococcota bacterium]